LYFLKKKNLTKKRVKIIARRKRKYVLQEPRLGKKFTRGDILTVNFWSRAMFYFFEGIVLAQKQKTFTRPNTRINMRNVLLSTGVEITASFYYNRLFRGNTISDYKRKKYNYRSAKLYYLCLRKNRATRVK